MEIESSIKLISSNDKNMSNGMRDMSAEPLTEEEIEFVKSEIERICADPSVFVFNDEAHLGQSTCYNFFNDTIYVTRNVFPDVKYGSTHPRDLMSVGAVLAHEYYGHRLFRDEYLSDYENQDMARTTPEWEDECRASITAAKTAPNLTDRDKSNLVMDAIYRAEEYGNLIEMDDFMKEVVYGYKSTERSIAHRIGTIHYVSKSGADRIEDDREDRYDLSEVSRASEDYDDFER